MKTINIFLLIMLCVTSIFAQPKTNLSGNWIAKSGTPDNPGEIYFTFKHVDDSLKTSVSMPMYGDKFMGMPLPPARLKNDSIRFPTFDGNYIPENDQISANINFLYEAVPFTLTRTNEIGQPVLETANVSGKKPDWTFEASGRIWSSPLLLKNQLFFGCDDSCFYTLNASDGSLIRKFRTGGKIRGKAAVSGENLLFTSDDGFVYCLNSQTGKLVWKSAINNGKYQRRDPSMTDGAWDYAISSPLVSGKTIYIGSTDSCLHALDANSGKAVWKFKTDHIVRATPQVSGNLVYCGNWSGKFYAVDRKTGKQVWMADLHQPILSQPAIANNRLIIGSRHAWLWCLDATNGNEIWKYNYWWSWVESSPVIEKGIIYIGSSDLKRVLAIDLQSGKTIWKFRTSGYPYTAASLDKSTVYMGSMEFDPDGKTSGFLYLLNRKTGELQEKIEVPRGMPGFLNGIHGDIALGKAMFYAASLGGKIIAFRK